MYKKNFQSLKINQIAFILSTAYFLFVLISLVNDKPLERTIKNDNSKNPTIQQSQYSEVDLSKIIDWHLFGQSNQKNISIVGDDGLPPETKAELKLIGVFFLSDNLSRTYAIIEGSDQSQKKVRPGDEVQNGIILQSISKEQVILLINQQSELLSMDKNKSDKQHTIQ